MCYQAQQEQGNSDSCRAVVLPPRLGHHCAEHEGMCWEGIAVRNVLTEAAQHEGYDNDVGKECNPSEDAPDSQLVAQQVGQRCQRML